MNLQEKQRLADELLEMGAKFLNKDQPRVIMWLVASVRFLLATYLEESITKNEVQ